MSLHTKTHQPRQRNPGLRNTTVRSNTPGTANGRMADGEGQHLNERIEKGKSVSIRGILRIRYGLAVINWDKQNVWRVCTRL